MKSWFSRIWISILLRLFMWSGAKLWPVINVYAPNPAEENVRAMIFCDNEETLVEVLNGTAIPE